jgi:hypothetical protein
MKGPRSQRGPCGHIHRSIEAYTLARGCPEAHPPAQVCPLCPRWLSKVTGPTAAMSPVPPPLSIQALCDALEAVQYEGHEQVSEYTP